MQNQIMVNELNQPSAKALKAFNQCVYEAMKQYQQKEQDKDEVTSHE